MQYMQVVCNRVSALKSTCISRRIFTVYTKGSGIYGALGQSESLKDSPNFKEISLGRSGSKDGKVSQLSAGWGHSGFVTEMGKLYVCGRPFDFSNLLQLHRISKVSSTLARIVGKSTNSSVFGSVEGYFALPKKMDDVPTMKQVACSAGLTLALATDGSVYVFGQNRYQQCNIITSDSHIGAPVLVEGLPKCKSVATGLQHCVALSSEGDVFTWGKGNGGQLGRGENAGLQATLAAQVPLTKNVGSVMTAVKALAICAGFGHAAAVSEDGAVYVWGKGMSDVPRGSKRDRMYANQFTPRRIELPEGRKAVDVVGSNGNMVITAEDRSLWVLGMGEQDRKMYSQAPLRVQTDFHDSAGLLLSAEVREANDVAAEAPPAVFLNLPSDGILCRGHTRVAIILPSERRALQVGDGSAEWRVTISAVYDVVVHEGEAFLKEVHIDPADMDLQPGLAQHLEVKEYCSGWQHSLLLLEAPRRREINLHDSDV